MNIGKLQYIVTNSGQAETACHAGVRWIQLRLKDITYDEYRAEALKVQEVCSRFGAKFIVNDIPRLALDIQADGVHVGKQDPLNKEDIDQLLERGMVIGCTANTIEDFEHLSGKAVSYIGLGPFRFTTTKQQLSPILGLDGYMQIFAALADKNIAPPPVIGIGGILPADVPVLLATGLHGIAVSGGISQAADPTAAAKEFLKLVKSEVTLPSERVI